MRGRPHESKRAKGNTAFIKNYLISKQVDRKKNLIRSLFRACGDRTVGERFLSKERPPEENEDEAMAEKTVFENVDATVRPVLYPVLTRKFKWKKRQCKSDKHPHKKKNKRSRHSIKSHKSTRDSQRRFYSYREKGGATALPTLSETAMHQDFITAYKIMVYVKQHNLLDNILNEDQTEEVRQFFETELSRPTYRVSAKVMRLLHEAFNKCWDKVMDDCQKIGFTNDVGLFLSEREKAKAYFLDVMLFFPEYIPESWGGRHIVEISLPHPDSLVSARSQYTAEDILTPSQMGRTLEQNTEISRVTSACSAEISAKSIEPGWTENELTSVDDKSQLKSTMKKHNKTKVRRRKSNGSQEGQQKGGHKKSSESGEGQVEMSELSTGRSMHDKKRNMSKIKENRKHKAEKSVKEDINEDIGEESKLRERRESEGKEKKKYLKKVERNGAEMEIDAENEGDGLKDKPRSKSVPPASVRAEDEEVFSLAANEGSDSNRSQKSKMKNEGSESNKSDKNKVKHEASGSNKHPKK